ncbi:hypothetical protein [Natronorubrum sp. DTA28]|uniref:hypothetical protein n=1 Tax=Natronorubrum sp. DTA28 TaxID=3447019 RepID=UPI003F84AED7
MTRIRMDPTNQTTTAIASRLLPWFRVVFGAIGLLVPRVLGRWYGLSANGGSLDVALRYACIRALGLGIGQLTASGATRREWDRIALLIDVLDTLMLLEAAVRGRIPKRSALVMLSGTVSGVVVGLLVRRDGAPARASD